MVYLLPFLSYLAGSKSVFARPGTETITITTLEAIASSIGKNGLVCHNLSYAVQLTRLIKFVHAVLVEYAFACNTTMTL